METFPTFLENQKYQVSFHLYIGKFMIVHDHKGLHLMYLQPDGIWVASIAIRFVSICLLVPFTNRHCKKSVQDDTT